MRVRGALLSLLLLAALAAGPASAHNGEAAVLSGSLELAPNETRGLPIVGMVPGDTLEWNWSTAGENVSLRVAWVDSAGATHKAGLEQREYGRFVAPSNLTSAQLEWTNGGAQAAQVAWSYTCTADFWSQPWTIAAALIPVIFLIVALFAGNWVDKRAKARTKSSSEQGDNKP